MARTKIAPTLTEYVTHGRADPYRLGERLRSELRALLAVARAAERVERLHKRQWARFRSWFDARRASGARSRKGAR